MDTTPDSKKILWHSVAPWAGTGYGQQTATFTPRIRDLGYDVAISATWGLGGNTLDWNGIPVYPSDDSWGNILLPSVAEAHQADLVIALMDAWVLQPSVFTDVPLAVWVPVDHQPCPPRVADFFRKSGARPIAFSQFGQRMLQDEGLDALYVPHGIDTNVFKPHDRDHIRELVGVKDNFLVGIVANNSGGVPPASGPPRKAFPQSIMAFSAFLRKHPDAKLYLHTEITGRQFPGNPKPGLNIAKLLDRFEVPESAVMTSNQLKMETGIESDEMAALFSSFDVLLNPSYGEGFGIPIVEAQACGTPVIVTDWTSMPELCGAGWKIDGEPWYDPAHDSFFLCPSVGLILDALEDAYENAGGMRGRAREFALAYDADRVTQECWVPALDALMRPREVAPLPNRETRRAMKKAGVLA